MSTRFSTIRHARAVVSAVCNTGVDIVSAWPTRSSVAP